MWPDISYVYLAIFILIFGGIALCNKKILSLHSEYMEIKVMEFMTVKQAAEKWGLSERRLQTMCNEGMIPGVIKFGRAWAIPMDAEKPVDKRIKSGKYIKS